MIVKIILVMVMMKNLSKVVSILVLTMIKRGCNNNDTNNNYDNNSFVLSMLLNCSNVKLCII